ncbi:SubName: Full=Uncharacterized protein {ECO:0000313/EMBL:CCA72405.1} [Serendipita indica DSM 11827]|uniref:Uncharacterized protein n=1 Tax=Serendipita indica (strain DSM 11827) TaxID=1109443 RepID=G4TM60_SERID|nr:SubName: Full=Uncharacterized protein {ECO:0000313/EMBL:CCA72405.1} [Serendipita indica DSM 11827]CCA72405.1 hypothetical protein PIIN_06339 [Serendipita indica DSM 11827]
MNPDTLRSLRRITVGSAAIIGVGAALLYFQLPRNEQEMMDRLPEDKRNQAKQKRFIREQYERQQRASKEE